MTGDHIPDTYVSGLSHIELIGGGCARFCLYVIHTEGDLVVRKIAANLIMPIDAVPDAVRKTMRITGDGERTSTLGLIPEIVH